MRRGLSQCAGRRLARPLVPPALALLAVVALAGRSAAADERLSVLAGTAPVALGQMADVGAAPPETPLAVTVVLGLRNRDELEAIIAAQQDGRSARFRQWLDATELADRFGPRRAEYERVREWFAGHGFAVTRESPYRMGFVAETTVARATAALATPIRLYRHAGKTYRGPAVDVLLPEEIAGSVRGILGLDDLPKFRPVARLMTGELALAPADFATVYHVAPLRAAGATGAGQTIAVVARSNFDLNDVNAFAARFLQPPEIAVTRKFVDGTNPGILPDAGEEVEVLIDTQWAGALAPNAGINVIISPKGGDIPDSLHEAVARREGDVISISFSLCETEAPVVATEYFDSLYALANAQGQTVVVASGDSGASECVGSRGGLAVNALASSAHAIAVGGTSFSLPATGTPGPDVNEDTWNDAYGASGGGESVRFARPPFQLLAGVLTARGGRALPDVALAASPRTPGYVMVENGATHVIGGTSASAPAFASVLALVGERVGTRLGGRGLGQLLPSLYRLGSEQLRGLRPPVFRDVVAGDNGYQRGLGFSAGVGFDLATGWGAPFADALADGLVAPGPCDPPERCLVPARTERRRACAAEWLVERQAVQDDVRVGLPASVQSCRDGDPGCDADGMANGRCTIDVALCVNVLDTRPGMLAADGSPACPVSTVRNVRLLSPVARPRDATRAANRIALIGAFAGLPAFPTTLRTACTTTVPIVVPVEDPDGRGTRLRARVGSSRGGAVARLGLRCTGA